MIDNIIYGPWIKWHGGECPVPPDTMVEVKFRDGDSQSGHPAYAYAYSWHHDGGIADIMEYCVAIEYRDLEAAEQLLRANGYTVIPPAKPLSFEDVVPLTEAPQKGTWYWVIQPFISQGVEAFAWGGDVYDLAALRHRMAYPNKDHALVAAQHLFGLKGGEL